MKLGYGVAYGALGTLLLVGVVLLVTRPPAGTAIELRPPPSPAPMWVHVAGAVAQPGVYGLPYGSRVRDAIAAAGGLAPGADTGRLNLAAHINDGERIDIPALLPTPANATGGEVQPSPLTEVSGELININRALQAELESLPGIGPVTARAILDYREEHGPFGAVEEILDVPGIGPVKYEGIKDLITVEP